MRRFGLMAGLLLLCGLHGGGRRLTPSTGYILSVAEVPPDDPKTAEHQRCGDVRYLIATATPSGRVVFNGEHLASLEEFEVRIREVLRYRALKLVYAKAEPETSWGQFLDLVDRLWPEAEAVSIITPEVERSAQEEHCLGPGGRRF